MSRQSVTGTRVVGLSYQVVRSNDKFVSHDEDLSINRLGFFALNAFHIWGLQEIGWIGGSAVDTGGVEIKTAEVKVDGVAEALAVTKAAR